MGGARLCLWPVLVVLVQMAVVLVCSSETPCENNARQFKVLGIFDHNDTASILQFRKNATNKSKCSPIITRKELLFHHHMSAQEVITATRRALSEETICYVVYATRFAKYARLAMEYSTKRGIPVVFAVPKEVSEKKSSLLRVINAKFPLHPHQKYYITQV